MNRLLMVCMAAGLISFGCSDDSGNSGDFGLKMDLGAGKLDGNKKPDTVLFLDLGALPDLGAKGKCDSEWRTAIVPQSFSSTGVVTTTDDATAGLKKTVIDATAGGMTGSTKNPYVYISLKTGKRVDLDDYKAKTDTTWDIALKRYVIRVNGGDSGAGKGAVSIVTGSTDLTKLITIPAASTFAADDFLDASCNIATDPIGQIVVAFGGSSKMWYINDSSTNKLTPKKQLYVVKLGDGSGYAKVEIVTYYGGANNTTSANYTIRWAPLK